MIEKTEGYTWGNIVNTELLSSDQISKILHYNVWDFIHKIWILLASPFTELLQLGLRSASCHSPDIVTVTRCWHCLWWHTPSTLWAPTTCSSGWWSQSVTERKESLNQTYPLGFQSGENPCSPQETDRHMSLLAQCMHLIVFFNNLQEVSVKKNHNFYKYLCILQKQKSVDWALR